MEEQGWLEMMRGGYRVDSMWMQFRHRNSDEKRMSVKVFGQKGSANMK